MPNPRVPAADGAMSVGPAQTSEYRALTVYSDVPRDHIIFPVTSNGFEPHLRLGEIAIVDTGDRELVNGELFVIRFDHSLKPEGVKSLVQVWPLEHRGADGEPFVGWWVGCLNRPRGMAEVEQWLRERREITLSDGPYKLDHLREKLIGRVVGVYAAPAPARAALTHGRSA